MIGPTATLNEIRQLGLKALVKELGPVGFIRFLQQFETGYGDYTIERETWLTETDLDTLIGKIQQHRQASNPDV
ncbi:MAG: hypothetical protein BroJett011_65290 [Chloroflexota bacterium]|nr:MAG: hypothetical protein BroJett011_65290 [Chloroflexota bacterium]